jgi:hypothetical protein
MDMMIYPDTYAAGTTNGHSPEPGLLTFLIRIPAGQSASCKRCGATTWSGIDLDWKHPCQAHQ